jgi:hypothetical protein
MSRPEPTIRSCRLKNREGVALFRVLDQRQPRVFDSSFTASLVDAVFVEIVEKQSLEGLFLESKMKARPSTRRSKKEDPPEEP